MENRGESGGFGEVVADSLSLRLLGSSLLHLHDD